MAEGQITMSTAELLDKCIGSQIWVVMKTGQLARLVRDAELDAKPSVYRAGVRRETAGLRRLR